MRYVDLINKKRQAKEHTKEEIQHIITGVTAGDMPDYQLAAWLMAVCLNGMSLDETAYLTEAIVHSGETIDLSSIGDYVIDKHSTGGVGDKTTLVLSPLLASVGAPIAKLSGRGLGHTGGTIDKLEAIPGFNTAIETDKFLDQVKRYKIAIGSQTAKLAPADGIIYALRDVTATVESIPLIASSVLSKKIASGANVIILDVKYGTGAFMKSVEEASTLANTMVEIGKRLNKQITCIVTSMEQPLGGAVGHALEVIESAETLKGNGPQDLTDLCIEICSIALVKAKMADDLLAAKNLLKEKISNGEAFKKFEQLVELQNGDKEALSSYDKLPQAKFIEDFTALQDGYILQCDALTIAQGCKLLGAGRDKKSEPINLAVGTIIHKKVGDKVSKGDKLATIYADDQEKLAKCRIELEKAFKITPNPVEKPLLINKIIGA